MKISFVKASYALLTAFLVIGCLSVKAQYTLTLSDINYTITDGELTITAYTNATEKNIVIPENFNVSGDIVPVTGIGVYGFYRKSLTAVVIPTSITSFDLGTFNINNITELNGQPSNGIIYKRNSDGTEDKTSIISYGGSETIVDFIPNTVTDIEEFAFAYTSITSVTIPSSVRHIRNIAFSNCSLATVLFEEGLMSIGQSAFSNNNIVNLDLPISLISIGEAAFRSNSLVNLTIPFSVTSIGHYAFRDNLITNLNLPSSVRYFGKGVFNNNSINQVNSQASVGLIYGNNDDGTIDETRIVSYGGVADVVDFIPESVMLIDSSAFMSSGLTSVIIPANVDTIRYYAFGYNSIPTITLPDNLMFIGSYAFYDNSIASISIPNKVTFIGKNAFYENAFSSITLPNHPTLNSLGWEDDRGRTYPSGRTVGLRNSLFIPGKGSLYFYIEYDAYGGEHNNPAEYVSSIGVASFSAPSLSGFVFDGWQAESSFDTQIASIELNSTGDKTLYAKWLGNIVFDPNGGEGNMNDQSVILDSSASLQENNYLRTGYSFLNWNSTVVGSGVTYIDEASYVMNNGHEVLYAQWLANSYNVIYSSNGGSGVMSGQNLIFNTSANLTDNSFSRTGYVFAGWDSEPDGSGTSFDNEELFTMNVEGITLYAQWTANNYDVSFDANGASGTMDNQSIAFDASENLTVSSLTRIGYSFVGWNTVADGSGTAYSDASEFTMNTGAITLYAQWAINDYNIGFDNNGGAGVMDNQSITFSASANLAANSFIRTGYSLLEWNEAADGSGTNFIDEELFTMNVEGITLYAQWTAKVYDVTFEGNGGLGTMSGQVFSFDESKNLTANSFVRTGYTYAGWNASADGSGVSFTDEELFTMNLEGISLYAQWTANTYDIVYDANGGSGSMNNQNLAFEVASNLSANSFTRTGYTFSGWNEAADGSSGSFIDGELFNMNIKGITLYAQWTINNYVVNFFDYDGTTVLKEEFVDYSNAATAPEDPYRFEYVFTGWDVDFSKVTEDLEVTAQYVAWVAGDINGNGVIDGSELAGDIDGNGEIDDTEILGDLDGSGFIDNNELEGDANGDGQINDDETGVGIGLFMAEDALKIYPNPANTNITVNVAQLPNASISIVDMNGKEVLHKEILSGQQTIDVSNLQQGVYFVNAGGLVTKIIIRR